jgi:hypothetical protein
LLPCAAKCTIVWVLSKKYAAAFGSGILFTQPHSKYNLAVPVANFLLSNFSTPAAMSNQLHRIKKKPSQSQEQEASGKRVLSYIVAFVLILILLIYLVAR